ncbi:ribonuclease P 40kDa subunit-domain-containing protein [Flammula alnicola]|nr:ribonuclease P 40kDa subunit-domain-containing protein [Flammula alnicola]
MNIPQPEKRRVKVNSGTLPAFKIASLAACHPFSQQLDLVFPSNPLLSTALEKLETTYGKGKARLADVVNNAHTFVNSVEAESTLLVVSANAHDEDAWCIDPRGHLTLSVSKDTYERLGLVGQKLPFKNHSEQHVIDISLQKNVQSPAVQARQKTSLEVWDKTREGELGKDAGAWDVVYCSKDRGVTPDVPFGLGGGQLHRVQCKKKELQDLYVPVPSLSPPPETSLKAKSKKGSVAEHDEEILDDWNRRVESLFEWIGMAGLGAQRLSANDRVDPYVALYEHPTPSHVQNVTHLQWRGLLSPSFVKDVMETVITTLQSPASAPSFVGITCHALTTAPVSYIPYTATETGALQSPGTVPLKLPRADGEDTWSLILERPSPANGVVGPVRWCLAESLGQWDSRWG